MIIGIPVVQRFSIIAYIDGWIFLEVCQKVTLFSESTLFSDIDLKINHFSNLYPNFMCQIKSVLQKYHAMQENSKIFKIIPKKSWRY